ncbi:hypothetical protein BGZ47_003053 [Haplosporangium gracile]|nr:hypothetical protein BGZ47_003053 [Haplosporangium gracile]
MGGTVSREHARLPFGYTHARKEDHSCSASASSSASRRLRIANRLLLLKSQDSTTSVTPLQSPHHRLPIPEDESHLGGGGSAATGATGVISNGEGGLVGPTGFIAAHQSLPSLSSQDDDDGDNAEIVSLSSILNQGPEFKLQWHAVSQDLDLDPNVHTYPYPYTYPIPYPRASAVVATGSEGAKSSTPMAEAQAQVQVQTAEDNNNHHMMMTMDLIGSASTISEDDFDDSGDELKGPSDRKMDLIAALGIADMPDRAPSPGPQDIPFSFFTEEPTFHALQDPTSCHLFNNTRRYTTDGSGYSKGKEVRRPWMDMTDEIVVHLPQGFFDRYGSLQQDPGGDSLSDDFDVELEQEELPRSSRRLGKRLNLGNTGYSTPGVNFGGHNVSANTAMMMNMMMLSTPDEDVAHLSPIPFSELPSLTNIGLCSHGIVKLSSNIRLLSSTTCLQVCCNDLCVIPPEIGFLRNLTLLDLSKNSLMTIPDSIRFLTKLVDLRLSSNFIDTLPPSIGELTKLTHLSLENNQLKHVPLQLGLLKALTHLILDDNPITVLPAEVGQLQYLRRLKLERCPLVREFVHSPVHTPPTLMELAARVILRQGMVVPSLMPSHLKSYLRTSQRCSFCDGPYFESSVKRGKMIAKNELLVPLEYTLCMPHWNTEMERVKLLFGPRPVTSPKPCTPRRTAAATGLLATTSEAGAAAGTAAAVTTSATTTTRRHMKSESTGPVLASTAASVLGGDSSSPVSAYPVGQAPLTFSLTPLSATSVTVPPISETSSPNSSGGSGNGSSTRKSHGFRSKLGSSGGSGIWATAIGSGSSSSGGNSSGWFSSSNNNSETNLTSAAASGLSPLQSFSSVSTMASIATAAGVSETTTATYPELSSMSMSMSISMATTALPLNSRSSFSLRTKKSRFSNPFALSRANNSGSIVGGGER